MFDPFGDFDKAGYLRNKFREKDLRIVKRIEHETFLRHLPEALDFLRSRKSISYQDFLKVHEILFLDFYPWAGQDRSVTAPKIAILKGTLFFSHPLDARRAVDEGLRIGREKSKMKATPGTVIGLFAYGHPFLDGNSRTMLLVHMALCQKAGFTIDWARTTKTGYLSALSEEIAAPNESHLNTYLLNFVGAKIERSALEQGVLSISGLDGIEAANAKGAEISGDVDGALNDPGIAERYLAFDKRRGYVIADEPKTVTDKDSSEADELCNKCHSAPCVCRSNTPGTSGV